MSEIDDIIKRSMEARARIIEAGRRFAAQKAEQAEVKAVRIERLTRLSGLPPASADIRKRVYEILVEHDVYWADIASHVRRKNTQAPRVAVYTYLRECGWSYPQIAKFCNRSCHTSVMYAINPHAQKRRKSRYEPKSSGTGEPRD